MRGAVPECLPAAMLERLEWRALAAKMKRGGVHLDHKPAHRRLDDWRFDQELRRALAAE